MAWYYISLVPMDRLGVAKELAYINIIYICIATCWRLVVMSFTPEIALAIGFKMGAWHSSLMLG